MMKETPSVCPTFLPRDIFQRLSNVSIEQYWAQKHQMVVRHFYARIFGTQTPSNH
jgi:hypothetical protein